MAGYACRHCGARSGHGKIKRKPRGDFDNKVLMRLREMAANGATSTMKEALSVHFNIATKYVEQTLHRLNLRGFVSQPEHRAPHDSTRDKMVWGTDSSWMGDIYYLRRDKLNGLPTHRQPV